MERFMWQSYPQYLQNTLFHADTLAPLRKKTLQDRLAQAYVFKQRGDLKLEREKPREALAQYECAYGMFKYCEKHGGKIHLQDDAKLVRRAPPRAMAKHSCMHASTWPERMPAHTYLASTNINRTLLLCACT